MRLSIRSTFYAFHIAKWLMAVGIALVQTFPTDMQVLTIFIALDFISGLLAGYKQKKLDSEKGVAGLIKKTSLLMMVWSIHIAEHFAIAHLQYMNYSGIGKFVAGYYTMVEFLSIMENYSKAGGDLPKLLVLAMINARKFMPKSMSPDEVRKALDAGIIIDVESKVSERITMKAPAVDPEGKAAQIMEHFRTSTDGEKDSSMG